MRKLLPLLVVSVVFTGISFALAAEQKTIRGEAVCAKCALAETPKCQNVVIVKEDGKDVNYYLEGAKSTAAHQKLGICKAQKGAGIKVKVVGSVEKKDGKLVLTVDSIDKAE
jgi:hypothetical protein